MFQYFVVKCFLIFWKMKPKFIVNVIQVDQYGLLIIRINDKIYEGQLPGKHIWDDYLKFIRNRGILISKIKSYCKLEISKNWKLNKEI